MQTFDLVAVGDAILDTFLTINNETDFCSYNKATNQLMLYAGEKILVDEASFMLGGNACNVSVGVKRLGFATGLIAEFGGDEFAAKLRNGLTQEGVSLDYAKVTENTPSTFSVGIHVAHERTLFVHHVERAHEMSLDGVVTKWIYLTSMGKEWEDLYRRVAEYAKKENVKLAFNPGSQQLKDGAEKIKDVLLETDILFINRDEAEEILYGKVKGPQEKEKPEDLLFRLQRIGCKMICMTDGDKGSFVLDESGKFYSFGTIEPASYTGKTGAGDSFASGFLGAILYGKDIPDAMKWGSYNAAAVLEHIGAQTGLLTKEEMERRIAANNV